ncbi:hypothetical protein PR048_007468 [Dryococelus australis]|uniref:Uncharacterized protein n=1 Tax=Dryococelus australis TaxID=614101 RepID=A0ABQ9HUC1_9NEOP|nr:hypothetical protein PR048_007468 [Dryococelus australis]
MVELFVDDIVKALGSHEPWCSKQGTPVDSSKALVRGWLVCRKSPKPAKEGKKPRVWDLGGNKNDVADLERTRDKPADGASLDDLQPDTTVRDYFIVGK